MSHSESNTAESNTAADVKGDFEAWAVVSARLLKRSDEEREAIVESLRLTDVWAEADQHWSEQISDGIIADDMRLAQRYGEACAVEILARRAAAGELPEGPQPPTPPPKPAPEPQPVSARQPMVTAPGTDMTVNFSGPAMGAAVPFFGKTGAPEPAPELDANGPPSSSGTVALSGGHLAAHHGAASPFGQAQAAFPQLTVQQYAKFSAEFGEQPERQQDIYASFGIADESAHRLLHAHWTEQLAQDQTTNELFHLLYQRFCKKLRNGK